MMKIFDDFKKPFNLISLSIGILGIVLTIYYYYNTKKTKALSYHVEIPSLIYDTKNASPAITVVEKDSIAIKDNVYILTGVIWNSGNIPISKEDVRQDVSLSLLSAKKILDFKIMKQVDAFAKFDLRKSDVKTLILSWKYFDPGDAMKFQIVYTGRGDPQFQLNGKLLDINDFEKQDNLGNPLFEIIKIIIFAIGLTSVIIVSPPNRHQYDERHLKIITVIRIIMIVILIFLLVKIATPTSNDNIPLF